ncbi:cell division control protein Cdc6 [Candidatus Pacearchaeota archaeon CG10_big_fil_rev_8_21_14_0_10_32_14]|nr:MAG: cell division control protein Cdc6 [Candidatus Pacearchaeota archaeon CG10_big_fil_rev_8_21_14_0_10_32_14]
MKEQINAIFDSFDKNPIFKNKDILQNRYSPNIILHREEQINQIASILAPVLRGERPSNLFLYGMTGTGKTLSIHYVKDELLRRAKKNTERKLNIIYVNCKIGKVAETEYRILAKLISHFNEKVPETGLPTDTVYKKFVEIVDSEEQLIILILDEIDELVKKISDDFLYNLTRLNAELTRTKISVVGISNDTRFLNDVNPRVKSSLSEEEIVFPPYNAIQLKDILEERAKEAFKDNVIDNMIIAKCAAFAAKVDGDARRALDLMRVAGELAERDGRTKISESHIDEANDKIERDKILDVITAGPRQFKIVLNSIIELNEGGEKQKKLDGTNRTSFFTGDVYNHYAQFCERHNVDILTQRRVGDIIQEMDMLGIINVRVISKGRHGRMREIKLIIPNKILGKAKENIRSSFNYD